MHEEIRNRRQVAAPLCMWPVDHINVPRVAAPSKDLSVLQTEKIVAVPVLMRRGVCDDAGCIWDILFLAASARHPQHVERNSLALIDPGNLLRDFGSAFKRQAPQVGETTIRTLTLPASALNTARTAAGVFPTTE